MALKLEIVTPEKTYFSDTVDSVVIPAASGEMGILPQHIPVMALLTPGELRYLKNGQETAIAVGRGLAEVLPNAVSILTDMAFGDAEIDENETQEAIKRAEDALKGVDPGSEQQEELQLHLMNALAKLNLKKRRS